MLSFETLIDYLVAENADTLTITPGHRPTFTRGAESFHDPAAPDPLTAEESLRLVYSMMHDDLRLALAKEGTVAFELALKSYGRVLFTARWHGAVESASATLERVGA